MKLQAPTWSLAWWLTLHWLPPQIPTWCLPPELTSQINYLNYSPCLRGYSGKRGRGRLKLKQYSLCLAHFALRRWERARCENPVLRSSSQRGDSCDQTTTMGGNVLWLRASPDEKWTALPLGQGSFTTQCRWDGGAFWRMKASPCGCQLGMKGVGRWYSLLHPGVTKTPLQNHKN